MKNLLIAGICALALNQQAHAQAVDPIAETPAVVSHAEVVAVAVPSPDAIETSWRLLGPSFSKHFSKYGAPVNGFEYVPNYLSTTYAGKCNTLSGSENRNLCEKGSKHLLHGWNQNNIGLGLEYDRRDSETVGRYYAGFLRDSFDKPSIYVGSSYQWTVAESARLRADAGFITMLWKRSVVGNDDVVRSKVLLTGLPMFSVEDKATGLGMNISFIPKLSWKGHQRTVNTLTAQFSMAIR